MTIGDILVNTNRANLNNLLPLSEVKTKKDFAKFKKKGYTVGMTAGEFQEKYPLLPIENIYASYNILSSLYYCEPQNPTIPIVLNLQIYGDKRLSVANESDEAFQNRILSIAKAISEGNVKRIRSYLFSLEDSFRVSVLSQYIKNAEPSTELYDLFMDYYKLTDYGFKNLNEADIRKVLSGKSEEQKKKTAEKLRKFPDTITVYRGEGSKSTPYTQSFSWTVSYKAACFFACRLPSAEDSTIVSAEVSKDDIIEFFPERNEAEVVILPSAVKSVKVDTLYGLESVEEEILEIMPLYQAGREEIRHLYAVHGKLDANESGHDALHTLRVLFNALLLVEMDGFGVNEGIIVMAATNRVDILDPAILRPGRFDRRVVVGPPDVMGREEILKVHAKNKPLAEDVDLKQIAQTTAGFTGAELENLLNEAAIMAAKDRRRFVRQADIKSAFIKVGIGAEKRSKVISDKEKRITAYHETGHAILFHMLPDMEAVYTISIIPTGPGAAGYTMPQPENDDMFQTRGKMMQYITVCLGGRVAEELIFDDITTGASQDIKQATATARSMITKYGMSENLGLVAYDSDSDEVFIGRDWGHTKSYSENVAAAIDEEVRQMIEKCHDQAKQIILEHSYVLHECAKQLMEKEKLSRAEFEAIFEQEAQMTGTAPEVSGEI